MAKKTPKDQVELTKKGDVKKSSAVNKAKPQLLELTVDYRNAMATEKLRRLRLNNDHQSVDLSKKTGEICYISVAMNEFQNAISSVYCEIKNADERLCDLLKLDMNQSELLHDFMQGILNNLADIDINLSTTTEYDADNYYAGSARKEISLDPKRA